jgi:hypothetical protein
MGYQPWGPHGPTQDANSVPYNPTPAYVPPAWPSDTPTGNLGGGGGVPSGYTGYSGGGAAYGGGVALAPGSWPILSLILAPFVWKLWMCLYPLPALAGAATVFAGALAFKRFLPPQADSTVNALAIATPFVLGLAVLIIMSRVDHRIGRYLAYRIPRHIVRLMLLGIVVVAGIQEAQGIVVYGPWPMANLRALGNTEIAIVLAFLVGAHFLLWTNNFVRRTWNSRLAAIWLRSKQDL